MKKLDTKLFGNRDGVHHISSLILKQPIIVIRSPVGFRVTVEAVSIAGAPNSNLETLQSFVEESSYPQHSGNDWKFSCAMSTTSIQKLRALRHSRLKNWIDSDMGIGWTLSLELMGIPSVGYLLSHTEFRFFGKRGHENMVIMPMKNSNKFKVTCIRSNNQTTRYDLAS
ncbi:unnamed protein product [Caenorhabditis brenneri]